MTHLSSQDFSEMALDSSLLHVFRSISQWSSMSRQHNALAILKYRYLSTMS